MKLLALQVIWNTGISAPTPQKTGLRFSQKVYDYFKKAALTN